jgi:predicted subunit of tRNA(5-methylaminomethyl-2-thiouridylate) methyltransferase
MMWEAALSATLGEQFAQFLVSDTAVTGLDAADLGAVALQDAGGVLQFVVLSFAVLAQHGANESTADRYDLPHGMVFLFHMPNAKACAAVCEPAYEVRFRKSTRAYSSRYQ